MSSRDPEPFDSVDADESDERDWLKQMEQRLDEADEATYRHPMTDEQIDEFFAEMEQREPIAKKAV